MKTQEQPTDLKKNLRQGGAELDAAEGMLSSVLFEEMQRAGYPSQPDRIREVSLAAAKRFFQEWASDTVHGDLNVETENQRIARENKKANPALAEAESAADRVSRKNTGTGVSNVTDNPLTADVSNVANPNTTDTNAENAPAGTPAKGTGTTEKDKSHKKSK